MAITYHDLVADSALRISALVGVTSTALNTTFLVRPLTQTNFQSTVFTFESVKSAIQMVEGKLVRAIAGNRKSIYRTYIKSTTATQSSGDVLPSINSSNKQIVGAWGNVHDATNDKPCRPKKLEVIQRINDNAGSRYLLQHYYFNIDGQRIYHTRSGGVVLDCCFYDGPTQQTAIDADSAILLPVAFYEAYVSGVVALLVRDDEFVGQAQTFSNYFNTTLTDVAVQAQL